MQQQKNQMSHQLQMMQGEWNQSNSQNDGCWGSNWEKGVVVGAVVGAQVAVWADVSPMCASENQEVQTMRVFQQCQDVGRVALGAVWNHQFAGWHSAHKWACQCHKSWA